MSPPFRKFFTIEEIQERNAKESSVLILLYNKDNKPSIVLIERAKYDGYHSKEIGLPGGKKDLNDIDLEQTAKRETFEEIGIEISDINIIAKLSYLYIPISNFIIFPFIAIYNGEPKFKKEDKEVSKIIEFSIEELKNSKCIISKTVKNKDINHTFKTPAYKINGIEIWGATAMILSEFFEIIER